MLACGAAGDVKVGKGAAVEGNHTTIVENRGPGR